MTTSSICVSAPGKVLLTGGYLVLDKDKKGIVIASTTRFYSKISIKETISHQPLPADALIAFQVDSSQFQQFIHGYIVQEEVGLRLALNEQSDQNAYIEETLLCAFNGITGLKVNGKPLVQELKEIHQKNQSIDIKLYGDNDFYSQVQRLQASDLALTRSNLNTLPRFLPPFMNETSSGEKIASKTGMGSSAALITSLVAALVHFFQVQLPEDEELLDVCHNLAQICHCFVQRKIGSGFDISAACYGSQVYSRFDASIIERFTQVEALIPDEIALCLKNKSLWNTKERVKPFSLSKGLEMLVGDVSGGSSTVSMVRKVLEWKKNEPDESAQLINNLNICNQKIAHDFESLNPVLDDETMKDLLNRLGETTSEKWTECDPQIGALLKSIRENFEHVRKYLRKMGEQAKVPIEPPSQTQLIDATLEIPGVLISGVPGAGGYDAIFVILLGTSAKERVENLWQKWSSDLKNGVTICPLLCDAASIGDGIRIEKKEEFAC